MKEITSHDDIVLLVNTFYDRARPDEIIGFIFNEIIGDDWSHHLPIMYSFWESVLFAKGGYSGNPIKTHIDIDKRTKLKDEHFARWAQLWEQTVDELFTGECATIAKKRATTMIALMQMKIKDAQDPKHIY